jgi:hypothetical protein
VNGPAGDGILGAMETRAVTGRSPADDDPRLRFRVWVAGVLADEHWLDADNTAPAEVDAASDRQAAIVAGANRDGTPWLVEIYDPAAGAYTRWGTDAAGMVCPVEITGDLEETLVDAVTALYLEPGQ